LRRRHVRGEHGLGARTVGVDGVAGGPADGHGHVERGEVQLELAAHRLGRAAGERRVGPRNDDHELFVHRRGHRAAGHRSGAPRRGAQNAGAPVALRRHVRVGSNDDHAQPLIQLRAQLEPARDDVLAVGHPAGEQVRQEARDGLLARALGPSRALDLEGDHRADHPQQRLCGRLAARPVTQLADDGVGDLQLEHVRAVRAGEDVPLVVRRRAGHRKHAARRVDDRHAGVQRASGRARDLRQPGPRFDCRGHVGERVEGARADGGLSVHLRDFRWRQAPEAQAYWS